MISKTPSNIPTPTFEARRAFHDCFHRIKDEGSAGRLWNRHLSDKDRQKLLSDPECRTLLRQLDCKDSRAPLTAVYRHYGTAGMWAALKGVSLDRAVIDVAHRLDFLSAANYEWLLREIGELSDPEEAMEAAIAAGDLVLVERPRTAHWNGEEIDIDWNKSNASWGFLWEISRQAKAGQPIDHWTFGESASMSIVTKRKHGLVRMLDFPSDLARLICRAGRGTQTLNLPREHIRIFEESASGTLAEWIP